MKALVVGAGAVGAVYARHLKLGGADVSFLVKPKYAEEIRQGLDLYPLNRPKKVRTEPVRLEGCGVITSVDEIDASYDLIVITVSSTALRAEDGAWLRELARRSGDATICSLQPGIEDRTYVAERTNAGARLVSGLISLISYWAPLPRETRFPKPGMAYWFPPMGPSPFAGPPERVKPIVEIFRKGGMPAVQKHDIARGAAFGGGILAAHIAALEAAGWSFANLRKGDLLKLASRAGLEAARISAHHLGTNLPAARVFIRPCVMRIVMRLAPMIVPLDVETYLGVHFTKVGDQTRFGLRGYVEMGKKAGLPTGALEELIVRAGWSASN